MPVKITDSRSAGQKSNSTAGYVPQEGSGVRRTTITGRTVKKNVVMHELPRQDVVSKPVAKTQVKAKDPVSQSPSPSQSQTPREVMVSSGSRRARLVETILPEIAKESLIALLQGKPDPNAADIKAKTIKSTSHGPDERFDGKTRCCKQCQLVLRSCFWKKSQRLDLPELSFSWS